MSTEIDIAKIVADDAAAKSDATASAPAEKAEQVDTTAEATTAPADEAAERPNGEAGEKPKKPGGGFQKRISELTREKHEALRREQETRELLARTTAALEAVSGGKQKAPAQSDEPRQDQFTRYEDYIAATAEHRADKRFEQHLSTLEKRLQGRTAEQTQAEKLRSFVAEAKVQGKGIEDFDEALETVRSEGFPISPPMGDYLLDAADNKAGLVKYLADNEDEAYRISRLSPIAAVKELAKVEARISAKPKPKTSSAPPPPNTVSGGAAVQNSVERLDHSGVLKWVREQDQRR